MGLFREFVKNCWCRNFCDVFLLAKKCEQKTQFLVAFFACINCMQLFLISNFAYVSSVQNLFINGDNFFYKFTVHFLKETIQCIFKHEHKWDTTHVYQTSDCTVLI